jgi:N-acetyl-gamma-glutamyl-phosphate reductase
MKKVEAIIKPFKLEEVKEALENTYSAAPFVRLLGEDTPPDTKNVIHTNFIDISWSYDQRSDRFVFMSVEDNLIKGASGQAIQSFNLMCGIDQSTGLV